MEKIATTKYAIGFLSMSKSWGRYSKNVLVRQYYTLFPTKSINEAILSL
jgi:hypothetical protein